MLKVNVFDILSLSIVDLSNNKLEDIEIMDVFFKMPCLVYIFYLGCIEFNGKSGLEGNKELQTFNDHKRQNFNIFG